jgi:hypothetical protein
MSASRAPNRGSGVPSSGSHLRELAAAFAALRERLAEVGGEGPLDAVAQVTVESLPAADAASITLIRQQEFQTAAWTGELARCADRIQYECGSGPCIDAITEDSVVRVDDVRDDGRWPQFGQRAADELGVASMLAFRLVLDSSESIGGLNVYSQRLAAFDDDDADFGVLLATHGALAVAAADNRSRADHLARALQSSRDIGAAMGILMATYKVTREQAFDLLSVSSQHSQRKLAAVALDVVETGSLTIPPTALRRPVPRPFPPKGA